MFNIIKTVIESKDYVLEDILYKIDKMYIQGRITEAEKTELDNLARQNAKAENSYNIQRQLDNIFARLEILENKDKPTEPGETEEYAEYKQPTGAHDAYKVGDKITYKDKKYICKLDNCVWSPETYPQGWEQVIEESTEENVESEG